MKIPCMIIDDEPLAQKGLQEYISQVPGLELVAVYDSAAQAYPALRSANPPRLLLLDIEMPELSGIDFLKSLNPAPAVIFTTAYPQYAVQGYELDVIDYLVKPFPLQRFIKAVTKARDFLEDKSGNRETDADYFFIKANHQIEKIFHNEVLYIEALQNYVAIHLTSKKLVSYLTISAMEKELPAHLFMRIHKSYIVALPYIEVVAGNKVIVQGVALPVSRMVKEKLMLTLQEKLMKR